MISSENMLMSAGLEGLSFDLYWVKYNCTKFHQVSKFLWRGLSSVSSPEKTHPEYG